MRAFVMRVDERFAENECMRACCSAMRT